MAIYKDLLRGDNSSKLLKEQGVAIEYTEAQIREYVKCMNDIVYFAKNYVKIVNVDRGLILFDTYDWQDELLLKFAKHRFTINCICRQAGKCHRFDSKITIKNKKTNETMEISIGDFYNMVKGIPELD